MNVQYETCMSIGSKCNLDPAIAIDTTGISCEQGEISPFYINVHKAADVQAAFEFSAQTGVPLSIKNTGHDYLGRSRRQNSLGLWTHNLQAMEYRPNFTPSGCTGSYRAIKIGAGVTFEQLDKFADDNNATFVGAFAQTVGASGGWIMGGGHSVLSPTLGLGVDRVLEIKLVTPDGVFRTVNACQNTDLFWALRGGGGGTFGVVLESTHRVEERQPIQVMSVSFIPSSTSLPSFFETLVNSSKGIVYVNPRLSLGDASSSMAPLSACAATNNGSAVISTLPSWYEFFLQFIIYDEASVGHSGVSASKLLPKTKFESMKGRAELVSHLVDQTERFGFPYIGVVTPISFDHTPGATTVTPAWRDSLWHIEASSQWPANSSLNTIHETLETMHEFGHRNLTTLAGPHSGVYFNEGDVYQSNHEQEYWGDNYPRLLAVKQKYDPMGLLDCWRCVGWLGPAAFPCYPRVD
ncbi:hypothetical protein FB45DRAFT_1065154 [Roridomyces roridus]|uniref:FAD-binding PCMH-type domain-containing protein n=1 Tax=Roridomyces roridus TaxID=1738132 RepID=A0AAD7FDW6_9AGAR|nr:hypothetical protein FB45DRAFT_1065154 [Roridomyces roridus]